MVLFVTVALAQAGTASAAAAGEGKGLRVVSDRAVAGFPFPESVGCDAKNKVLYVGQFVSELKPAEKDGKGKISKVALDGKVLEDRFLPTGSDVLHKPKGIWVQGNRLWVTDIDAVWVFDLKSRKGRKLELKGMGFANDVAARGNDLYVSDNRADLLYRIEPADFLNLKGEPQVGIVFAGKGVNPNGVYPARDGSLLMGGFLSAEKARGVYSLDKHGEVKTLAPDLGRIDGIYQLKDGTLLVTDWNTASLAHWSPKGGLRPLAKDFKGPADFCVIPDAKGYNVYAPDLAKSELRLIRLAK
jgi:hypothetical protein